MVGAAAAHKKNSHIFPGLQNTLHDVAWYYFNRAYITQGESHEYIFDRYIKESDSAKQMKVRR